MHTFVHLLVLVALASAQSNTYGGEGRYMMGGQGAGGVGGFSADMGGFNSGMASSTANMGGFTGGMGSSTANMGGFTGGMGSSTTNMGGFTGGMGSSTANMGGFTTTTQPQQPPPMAYQPVNYGPKVMVLVP
ncbi:hypothetical protein Pcinc_041081 [Petrolisthes cinctipes]|uniref:Uncharacterized protein n=1 Tax=Petrolisthes cinctipes TaxID=88211 RepID=A0AAE1EI41_PETCI|nr:hypothetical protein Pcinc_041081 [Petrolisthes cinctipes]